MGGGVIEGWAAQRGLQIAEDVIRKQLGITDLPTLMTNGFKEIDEKLDRIIQAPYKEARMHLRAGDLREAKSKLIQAMALNELDLPATLLYIRMLCCEQQELLALEYYLEVLDKFGFRKDLIPPSLLTAYTQRYVTQPLPPQSAKAAKTKIVFGVEEYENDFMPFAVWCCRSGILVTWRRAAGWWPPRLADRFVTVGYSWEGTPRFRGDVSQALAVTDTYAALPVGQEEEEQVDIYRWKDGSKARHRIPQAEYRALFGSSDQRAEPKAQLSATASRLRAFHFGGASFEPGTHYVTREVVGKYGADRITREYGELEITCPTG